MRVLGIMALLIAAFTVFLRADSREVIKTTVAGHESIFAHYVQDKSIRTEHLNQGGTQLVTIRNFERNKTYILDLASRKYVESSQESPDLILSLAQWIARPARTRESGKTVNIYYETIDTGERKEFFGSTAKHLLRRERHVAEPGACDQTYETEADGWYIPQAKTSTAQVSYRAILTSYTLIGSYQCHDTIVTHGDPSPPGVPVLETSGSVKREILELSHDPLDKSLFEIPSGFQKVEALPGYRPTTWSQRLQMEWAQLERAFESWFE
ncbi:MAG: hypothetical protein JOZ45_00935 [Acidobacteriaceae bacterium]|nr:hypothetical protein [Acidobacteriaceae bacterium]